jgi:hypothetical protein
MTLSSLELFQYVFCYFKNVTQVLWVVKVIVDLRFIDDLGEWVLMSEGEILLACSHLWRVGPCLYLGSQQLILILQKSYLLLASLYLTLDSLGYYLGLTLFLSEVSRILLCLVLKSFNLLFILLLSF